LKSADEEQLDEDATTFPHFEKLAAAASSGEKQCAYFPIITNRKAVKPGYRVAVRNYMLQLLH